MSPSDVLLIAAIFALLCLAALMSLARSRLPGIGIALVSNVLAFTAAAVLWGALRVGCPTTPALLVGNFTIAAAVLLLYAAFCRLSDRPVPLRPLYVLVPVFAIAYVAELVVWPSTRARVVTVSVAHVILTIGLLAQIWPTRPRGRASYGHWFTVVALSYATVLQGTRAVIYLVAGAHLGGLDDHRTGTTVLLALNALALAALLLGAVLLGHDRLMAAKALEADTDFLTGVLSPRAWHRRVEALRARGAEPTIFFADLDRFKEINDRYGHAAGDAVLRHTVAVLSRAAGPDSVIGRVGGEELALAFARTPAVRVQEIGHEALTLLAQEPPTYDGTSIPVSFSGGITTWRHSETLEQAMRRADAAMYRAKATGRALVVVADGDLQPS